jgi:O-antigen/teichoic acid export membrane protein
LRAPASPLRASLFNLGWLSFGRFLGDGAIFLLLVVISRWHGEEGLGLYAFAMAFTLFYAVAADLGIYLMFMREAPQRSGPVAAYFGEVFALGLALVALCGFALLLTLALVPLAAATKLILLVIGLYQLISKLVEGCAALFLVAHKTHLGSTVEVAGKAAAALAASLLIVGGAGLGTALLALPVVALGQLLAAWWLVVTRIGRPRLGFRTASLLALLKGTMRYAPSALQVPVYARADVIVLGLLAGAAAVGLYSAAFRIVFLLIVLANLAALALLPLIGSLHATSPERYRAAYHTVLRAVVLVVMPAAFGLALIAPQLIAFVFGPAFADAAGVLRLLSALVILFPLRALLAIFLTTANLQGARATIEWAAAAVVWVACLLLVPTAGVHGAALALLLGEATMVGLMLHRLVPVCGWPEVGSRLAISLLGIAAFSLPALLWPGLPLPLIVAAAMVIYVLVLALSADIRGTEYRLLRAAVTGTPGPAPLIPPCAGGRP